MKDKESYQKILYQNYRQFIQFINDQCISSRLCFILIYLPSITIFGDLLKHINQGQFWYNISSLSFSNLIINLIININWLLIFTKIILILCLSFPFFITAFILIWSAILMRCDQSYEIGYFYKKYNKSILCKVMRAYICSYQKLMFPILISIGIKLQMSQIAKSPASGILVMVFGAFNSLLFHYFNLQIPSSKELHNQNKQINFPNVVVESILLMITIIVINSTSGFAPFIACFSLFAVRTITNYVLRYQTGQLFHQTMFSILCGDAITLAIFLGYLTNQYTIAAICGCMGIVLLSQTKTTHKQTKNQYAPIQNYLEEKQMTIEDIKQLVARQKITRAFKQAVMLSRKKISHRNQLIIDILKSKCFSLQCSSRNGVKTANSEQLLIYEIRIVKILKNFLLVQQKAIQTLKLIKSKQPKQQMFIKNVVQLANLIEQNKEQFIKCLKINSLATQITVLMQLFFKKLHNDSIFVRQIMGSMREQTYAHNHKLIQKQLFSKDTALVVINVLDEIGKISKVSNNMQNVLGYTSHSLIGLSINELIPITIRQVHDNILNQFIFHFSSQIARNKPSVQFYAYNKMFHLQKVQVRYKFFLQFFNNFQLSGVIKQLKTQDYVIITDQFGNIEGWTSQIGQLFNFDQISGTDCQAYNLIPMLPSYAKYNNDAAICFRTIFFRLSKMKNQKLILYDRKKHNLSAEQIKKKQIQIFMSLLKQGEIIQGYLVNVQSQILKLKSCNRMMRIVKLIDIKRIQNFQKLQTAVLGSKDQNGNNGFIQGNAFDVNHLHQEKSFEESYDTDFSIANTQNQIQIHTDLNFTLDFKNPNVIDFSELKFSKDLDRFQSVFSSRSLLKIEIQQQKQEVAIVNQNLTIQSTFDPKLQRKSNFIWIIIIIALTQISILIQNQISLSKLFVQFQDDKLSIEKANRAEMIYCKTVFNPNQTYISEFNQGNLLVYGDWLIQDNFTYTSFDNNPTVQNQFYLFNIQIPSTLNRVLTLGKINSKYTMQLSKNFQAVVNAYEGLYTKFKQQWKQQIENLKTQFTYKIIAIGAGVIIYMIFLIFIYRRYKNQRKMTQAFFKFERTDIDAKITNIKWIGETLQKRCEQWFIDQYLNQIKKSNNNAKKQSTHQSNIETRGDVTKKQCQNNAISQQDISQRKISEQILDEQQVQIVKKRFYFFLGLTVVILATQIIFLILHGVLNNKTMESFETMMNKVDDASKLSVYPNLKMASLFYPVPSNILSQYQNTVNDFLNEPSQIMPSLFQLLKEKPCSDCTFLPEVLTTNYRSFYSYFIQMMQTVTSQTNLTDIYYAVDVVSEKIKEKLFTKQIPDHSLIILLYIFSLIALFYGVIVVLRDLELQCQKLECFLKFFDSQALTKNKHMSTIMAKNM